MATTHFRTTQPMPFSWHTGQPTRHEDSSGSPSAFDQLRAWVAETKKPTRVRFQTAPKQSTAEDSLRAWLKETEKREQRDRLRKMCGAAEQPTIDRFTKLLMSRRHGA